MLHNIKDVSPNQATIIELEKALAQAKAGDIRSVVIVKGWNDGGVSHGWSIDGRDSWRLLLSEICLLQHDFTVNIELRDGDSALALAL